MPLDKAKTPFAPIKLPYAENALEPVVSAKTISFHYGKHHKAYADKLNELVAGRGLGRGAVRPRLVQRQPLLEAGRVSGELERLLLGEAELDALGD